ncbi:MAG: hypothetical protein V7K15_03580 [Nostoc sp.]
MTLALSWKFDSCVIFLATLVTICRGRAINLLVYTASIAAIAAILAYFQ